MIFVYTVGLVLFISFLLSLLSLRDYKGERESRRIKNEYDKARIKGGILFTKDKGKRNIKHYSSYS